MDLNWLLGFIEGEGCFNLSFHIRNNYVYRFVEFQLAQGEREVLEKVKDLLASQNIQSHIYDVPNYSSSRGGQGSWHLTISKHSDLIKLVKLLESLEWHSKKRMSFEKWKRGLDMLSTSVRSVEDLKAFAKLSLDINPKGKGKYKWTPEFIDENCSFKDGWVVLNNSRGY